MEFANEDGENQCIKCGVDMGHSNPRQLCGILFCLKECINKSDEEAAGDGNDESTEENDDYDDNDTTVIKNSSFVSRKRSSVSPSTADTDHPVSTPAKKKKDSSELTKMPFFLSTEQFTQIVENTKPMKWADLDCEKVFRVLGLEEVTFYDAAEGKEKLSKYAELMDVNGEKKNVWLPSIVDRKLSGIDSAKLARGCIFIRALGLQLSRKTGRKYHNFEIAEN